MSVSDLGLDELFWPIAASLEVVELRVPNAEAQSVADDSRRVVRIV